jgi:DNA-3-methyladenine glycosylase II
LSDQQNDMTIAQQHDIVAHLARDPGLRPLVEALPFPPQRTSEDLYLSLLESIVSQQLSVKAADTIWGRFLALFPAGYPDPGQLLATAPEILRGAGLSGAKAAYLQNVAQFALTSGLGHAQISPLSDQELIQYLTQIKGVGKWTVEMQLIFALGHPDVFSVDDLAIRQVMVKCYGLTETGKPLYHTLHQIAEHWRPYRSWACRYLWNWKDQAK